MLFKKTDTMEEKMILQSLKETLPQFFTLFQKQKKNFYSFDFDKQADVLYISFDRDAKADDTEVHSDDILIRKHKGDIVGITVLHAATYLGQN